MAKIRTTIIDGIPSWAIPYFEYGYEACLPDEDVALIEKWQKENKNLMYLGVADELGFDPYPCFGKACDTYSCRFEILPKKK